MMFGCTEGEGDEKDHKKETDGADSVASDTDTDTDADTDTGKDTDTDTDKDTDTDTDTDTDSDTDTPTEYETDTGDGGPDSGPIVDGICGLPERITNGGFELPGGADEGDTAVYRCDPGYYVAGSEQMTVTTAYLICEQGIWQGEAPSCAPVTCPILEPPLDGIIEGYTDEQRVDSEVTFACDEDLEMQGDATRTCQLDGTWSGSTPACGDVYCAEPGALEHGRYEVSDESLIFGSQVTYTCDETHHIQGREPSEKSVSYSCEGTGTWGGEAPTCVLVHCAELSPPANGFIVDAPHPTEVGTVVEFGCEETFDMNGAVDTTCQTDGTWSNPVPACGEVVCEAPPSTLANGEVVYSTTNFGSEVVYTCDSNYHIADQADDVKSVTYECQSNGEWSGPPPLCLRVECDALNPPTNGRISSKTDGSYAGSVWTFQCDPNFDMQGASTVTCLPEGQWSGPAPACGLVTCEDDELGDLPDGTITYEDPTGMAYGTTVTFTCDPGFHIAGAGMTVKSADETCGSDGQWTGTKPTCEIVSCGSAPTYTNTTRQVTATTYGGTATYTCESGSSGTNGSLTCGDNGQWTGTEPSCADDCPTLSSITNGTISYNPDTSVGSIATYSCRTGYRIAQLDDNDVTSATRTCQGSGAWSGTAYGCERKDCGTPPSYANTTNDFSGVTTYETVVNYTCDTAAGYQGTAGTATCASTGRWSNTAPSCSLVTCSPLSDPSNGDISSCTNGSSYGSTCTATCNAGYEISGGSANRTCQLTGSWSGSAAVCSGITCNSLPTIPLATPGNSDMTYPETVTYTCNTGSTGSPATYTCNTNGTWIGVSNVGESGRRLT